MWLHHNLLSAEILANFVGLFKGTQSNQQQQLPLTSGMYSVLTRRHYDQLYDIEKQLQLVRGGVIIEHEKVAMSNTG